MGTVGTTTATTPLQWPANTLVDRNFNNGYLYALHRSSTANTFELRQSVDGGTTWTLHSSFVRANVAELGSILIPNDDHLYVVYRTNESSQDRIYVKRCNLAAAFWGTEVLTGSPANGGSAGAVHTGMDLQVVGLPGNQGSWVAIAAGTVLGGLRGITLYAVFYPTTGAAGYSDSNIYVGTRQWLVDAGTGQVTPSVDIEHTGTGKASPVPNLWVTWGRSQLRMVKLAWNGHWNGPTSTVSMLALTPAQDGVVGRWDGERFLIVVPDPSTTDRVRLLERNRANTATTSRQTPAHPTGVVRTCSVSYNNVTKDVRVYAVGTSTPDLYYVDFIRGTATWGAWATVTTTDVMGTPPNQFSVRRGAGGDVKHDLIIAHAGAPNTIVSYHQSLAYAPFAPTWDTATIGYTTGQAASVSDSLRLVWLFSDPDPTDTQSAYAISRQIGAGSLQYFRSSDATWQATEQKNVSGIMNPDIGPNWASGSDAAYTFKVKVWDSTDVASGYSDGLVLVPSVRADPTVTAPTQNAVITTGTVTATWSAAEQTAYRVYLLSGAALLNTNPFFTTDASDWTQNDASTFTRSTAQFHEGVASGRLVPDGTHAQPRVETGERDVAAGRQYSVSAWVRPDTANKPIRVYFSWFDAASVFISTQGDRQKYSPTAATWQYLQISGYPVPGAEGVRLGSGLFLTPAAGDAMYLDEAFLLDMSQAVYDSGWINDDITSLTPPTQLADNSTWIVGVQTKNLEGLSSQIMWARFTVDIIEPPTPTIAAAPIPTLGVIRVTITNPAPGGGQPAFASGELWRRVVGDTSSGVRVGKGLLEDAVVDDFGPASGVAYEYRALSAGVNGAAVYGSWTG